MKDLALGRSHHSLQSGTLVHLSRSGSYLVPVGGEDIRLHTGEKPQMPGVQTNDPCLSAGDQLCPSQECAVPTDADHQICVDSPAEGIGPHTRRSHIVLDQVSKKPAVDSYLIRTVSCQ